MLLVAVMELIEITAIVEAMAVTVQLVVNLQSRVAPGAATLTV